MARATARVTSHKVWLGLGLPHIWYKKQSIWTGCANQCFPFQQFAEVNEESLVAADSEGLILAEKSVEFQRMTSVTSKEGESGDIKLLELSQTQHVSER